MCSLILCYISAMLSLRNRIRLLKACTSLRSSMSPGRKSFLAEKRAKVSCFLGQKNMAMK